MSGFIGHFTVISRYDLSAEHCGWKTNDPKIIGNAANKNRELGGFLFHIFSAAVEFLIWQVFSGRPTQSKAEEQDFLSLLSNMTINSLREKSTRWDS